MKGTGAKRNVCPGSCVTTGAKFPVAPVESAPMPGGGRKALKYGISRKIREIWQPYVRLEPACSHILQSVGRANH